jgi:dihydrofolate reductase
MDGGETGVDDDFAARGHEGIGATIMGRNMFGPVRGEWDRDWTGWWRPEPP